MFSGELNIDAGAAVNNGCISMKVGIQIGSVTILPVNVVEDLKSIDLISVKRFPIRV
jgi:hypothetical protein